MDGTRVVGAAARIDAHRGRPTARCPGCGCGGGRVHDAYTRRLADRPLGGRCVSVLPRVRRFVCDEIACGKRTLVEQERVRVGPVRSKPPWDVASAGRAAPRPSGRGSGIPEGAQSRGTASGSSPVCHAGGATAPV
ncbi:transposase family protein [Embleya sp. NPDC055664]